MRALMMSVIYYKMIVVDINTPLKSEEPTRIQKLKRRAREFFCNGPAVLACFCCTIIFAFILGLLIANEIEFSK
jgi:hypothetical protein